MAKELLDQARTANHRRDAHRVLAEGTPEEINPARSGTEDQDASFSDGSLGGGGRETANRWGADSGASPRSRTLRFLLLYQPQCRTWRTLCAVSGSFVDFPAVADVVEVNSTEAEIDFIENAVVSNAELELGTPTQALVRERGKPKAHLVNLALNGFPD
jgi:hypothetical protein